MPKLREYWTEAWATLGKPSPAAAFDDLCQRYGEPQRFYHTLQHLRECFAQFALLRETCADPASVLLALWYHDAVYDLRASDNEARSARLADAVLREEGVEEQGRRTVSELILVTCHASADVEGDAAVLLDIDLSILAAPPARFAEYERQIREEYAWVPWAAFRQGRGAVLRRFLERPRIFRTEPMQALEPVARQNLRDSLERLERS